MTIVLAVEEHDGTFIASDARLSTFQMFSDNATKILPMQDYFVGFAGTTRLLQLIQHMPDAFNKIGDEADVFRFTMDLKDLLASQRPQVFRWQSLVLASRAGVFTVVQNFQYQRYSAWAIGSGAEFGLGAYLSTEDLDTEHRMRRAIGMTGTHVTSVGGRTTVYKVES